MYSKNLYYACMYKNTKKNIKYKISLHETFRRNVSISSIRPELASSQFLISRAIDQGQVPDFLSALTQYSLNVKLLIPDLKRRVM